jgi:CRP-like cAMP-binding protein
VEDTFLLQLNQDVFYEIMADRIEVVRGIVRILIRRLRDQNTLISDLKNEVKTLT